MRLLYIIALLVGCVSVTYAQTAPVEKGYASTYPTAKENTSTESGEVYLPTGLTACHASLPYGTLVKVTNIYNGKSVTVKINDHFCQKNYRLLDLSKAAATQIDLFNTELPMVSVEVVGFEKLNLPVLANQPDPNETDPIAQNTTIDKPSLISAITNFKLPSISLQEINNAALKSIKFITLGLVK